MSSKVGGIARAPVWGANPFLNKQEGDKTHLGTSGNNVATLHNRILFEQF